MALNHYKDFVRGQNHHDAFLLSGVSGHGAQSFYYPDVAKSNCTECHMELKPSTDFGAKDFDGKGGREIHDHIFIGANTGLPTILGDKETADKHAKFLSDKKVRVDIFGLREGGVIEGKLAGPLRPDVPELKAGNSYLVEVVVRTLGIGHPFSQGTVDSNEIWVELIARSGERVIGHSGGMGSDDVVDPYSHFINVYMLDRDGNRIDRRNPQDIFVPLYNKQIPPAPARWFTLGSIYPRARPAPSPWKPKSITASSTGPISTTSSARGRGPSCPWSSWPATRFPCRSEVARPSRISPSPIEATWQRYNDYGIGLFLEGASKGGQKGELKQAEQIFLKVAELGRADGWVNLAASSSAKAEYPMPCRLSKRPPITRSPPPRG